MLFENTFFTEEQKKRGSTPSTIYPIMEMNVRLTQGITK